MNTFAAVDDTYLAERVSAAVKRLVYVAPGVGLPVADAFISAMGKEHLSVTIILDADEEACRVGYGDADALERLHSAASRAQVPLRRQAGLRLGLLVADDELVIWAPAARSVEAERADDQPNAIILRGPVIETVEMAVGAESSPIPPELAEIGLDALRPEEVKRTVTSLRSNPPEPFDLARKTRVFSSRFQFVEFEVRGAEWTERRMKLSSLLLNADLPEELQDILDTQVRPFQRTTDQAFKVPHLVRGRHAYEENGEKMMEPATQADIVRHWADIRGRYLVHLKGFGWLIRRENLSKFQAEVEAYEETLKAWVDAFRASITATESHLIQSIVGTIEARMARGPHREQKPPLDLKSEVARGLQRLRVVEPKVRIVIKNVSWESTRDGEFMNALQAALPEDERKGWFEEFTAARER
jgi:hypothetical protein